MTLRRHRGRSAFWASFQGQGSRGSLVRTSRHDTTHRTSSTRDAGAGARGVRARPHLVGWNRDAHGCYTEHEGGGLGAPLGNVFRLTVPSLSRPRHSAGAVRCGRRHAPPQVHNAPRARTRAPGPHTPRAPRAQGIWPGPRRPAPQAAGGVPLPAPHTRGPCGVRGRRTARGACTAARTAPQPPLPRYASAGSPRPRSPAVRSDPRSRCRCLRRSG